MVKIKTYIVTLSEKLNDKIRSELSEFGVNIIFESNILPKVIGIETDKPLSLLVQFPLFEEVEEDRIGYLTNI